MPAIDPLSLIAPQVDPMPPNETENQLLTLLDRHLKSTEATIARLEGRVDALGVRFDSAIVEIRQEMGADARRQFYVQLLLVIVVAALGGANLYVQASAPQGAVTVATGTAASAPLSAPTSAPGAPQPGVAAPAPVDPGTGP